MRERAERGLWRETVDNMLNWAFFALIVSPFFDNVQPEIVERTWGKDDGTDWSHAHDAGCHAGDAEAGFRRTERGRRGGRAGRDAGRQLLARQPRHGRRAVRAVEARARGDLTTLAPPAAAIVPARTDRPGRTESRERGEGFGQKYGRRAGRRLNASVRRRSIHGWLLGSGLGLCEGIIRFKIDRDTYLAIVKSAISSFFWVLRRRVPQKEMHKIVSHIKEETNASNDYKRTQHL
jgi:hypothetical protein